MTAMNAVVPVYQPEMVPSSVQNRNGVTCPLTLKSVVRVIDRAGGCAGAAGGGRNGDDQSLRCAGA